ncbi:MAG TPA: chromate transporter [Terriglobales bacterium]|nr:chromate transporter [Terriglobales bacterium]
MGEELLVQAVPAFKPMEASIHEPKKQAEFNTPAISRFALFLAFSRITLSSFGGALFWTRRELVERQRWLTDKEFVEVLTVGQLLPGPNVLNLTVMVGYRFCGWTGAAASVAGYLGWPVLVVIGMGMLYQQFGTLPQVQQALAGMSKVAAGLLLATVIKLAMVLPPLWRPWLFGVLAFTGVGVMRWPLLWVVVALAPCAVFFAWKAKD